MPDIIGRDDWEAEVARRMGSKFRRHLNELMRELGDPPSVDNVSATFWEGVGAELQAELQPVLVEIELEAAEQLMGQIAIGVEWGLVSDGAVTWAADYSFGLVQDITLSQRQLLQRMVPRFFDEQWTLDQLKDSLAPKFGLVRAELIASTEVTRASVMGEMIFVDLLEQDLGRPVAKQWVTSMDEHVCFICIPLNELVVLTNEPFIHPEEGLPYDQPPAHPRCRCWLNYDLTVEGFTE